MQTAKIEFAFTTLFVRRRAGKALVMYMHETAAQIFFLSSQYHAFNGTDIYMSTRLYARFMHVKQRLY